MARKPRSYRQEQARRNALARSFGFRSYWERRQTGQHGAFLRAIRPGDDVQLDEPVSRIELDERGRYLLIRKVVIPTAEQQARGRQEKVFEIRNLTRRQLRLMIAEELRRGGNLTSQPSYDQRRLLEKETT